MKKMLTMLLLAFSLYGQEAKPIRGVDNTALIPDEIAYEVFLHTLSFPAKSNEKQNMAFQARTKAIGLDKNDLAALRTVLNSFYVSIENSKAKVDKNKKETPNDVAKFIDIDREVKLSRNFYRQEVFKVLSPEGKKKVLAHVEDMKKHINIVPGSATSNLGVLHH